jgi:hypothetical protein
MPFVPAQASPGIAAAIARLLGTLATGTTQQLASNCHLNGAACFATAAGLCVASLNALRFRCGRAQIALDPGCEITLTVFNESPETYPPRPCSSDPMALKRPHREAEYICRLFLAQKTIHVVFCHHCFTGRINNLKFAVKLLPILPLIFPASLALGGLSRCVSRLSRRFAFVSLAAWPPAGPGATQVIPEVHPLISR